MICDECGNDVPWTGPMFNSFHKEWCSLNPKSLEQDES